MRTTKQFNQAQQKKYGLNDSFFGRGDLIEYTSKPLGLLKGKGQIIDCPTCGKRGIERRFKTGNGMVVHSDQLVSMCGIVCNEIKESCWVKADAWKVGA